MLISRGRIIDSGMGAEAGEGSTRLLSPFRLQFQMKIT